MALPSLSVLYWLLLPLNSDLNIIVLNCGHIQTVLEQYHTMDDPDYIKNLMGGGRLYGALRNDRLAGFIGVHPEGSIGMLEVLPEFRRQGIGTALESYLVNKMV